MVLKGQFLERATVIRAAEEMHLEGLWHRGDERPALLIVPPHPRSGASMDAPVCAELAFAASRRGHPTLRFNYRGAGGSQGALTDSLQAALEDAAAALETLRANVGHGPVAVAGYEHGARVAVALARAAAVTAVALVRPGAETELVEGAAALEVPLLAVAGERDAGFDRAAWGGCCARGGDPFVLVPGADRAFTSGLTGVGRAVIGWLRGEDATL